MRLSKESAALLLVSQETVELIEFLSYHGIITTLSDVVEKLFSSADSKNTRITLLGVSNTQAEDHRNYRQEWSKSAGMGCPKDQFEAFHAALGDGPCAQDALVGFYLSRVNTESVETIRDAFRLLESNLHPFGKSMILGGLMSRLPDSEPFREIEEMLPETYPGRPDQSLDDTRSALFIKWAKVDRQAAFDHLIENPDHLSPKLIWPIAEAFLEIDFWKGLEWAQKLPVGPYFDTAAEVVILNTRTMYPKIAKGIAAQIPDPETRENSFIKIDSPTEEEQN